MRIEVEFHEAWPTLVFILALLGMILIVNVGMG